MTLTARMLPRFMAPLALVLALPAVAHAQYTIPGPPVTPVDMYDIEVDAGAEGTALTGYCPGPFLPDEAAFCRTMAPPKRARDTLPVGGVALSIVAPSAMSSLQVTNNGRPARVRHSAPSERASLPPLTVAGPRTLTFTAQYAAGYKRVYLLKVVPLAEVTARPLRRGATRVSVAANVDGKIAVGRTCRAAAALPAKRRVPVLGGATQRVTLPGGRRTTSVCVIVRADDRKRVQRVTAKVRP
ncbi:MAG: hypothetical protein ACEQSX_05805 [Baekduiaceae bacterium]